MADMKLTHGKHAGLTFTEALANAPSYAVFCAEKINDIESPMHAFAEYARTEISRLAGDMVVAFGKHSGRTYTDVFTNERGYADYLVRLSDESGLENAAPKHFAAWIRKQLPDMEG